MQTDLEMYSAYSHIQQNIGYGIGEEVSGIITQANYIEKLKRHNEKAMEYVIRTYGGCVKAAVYRNLAGHPEELEECMDDVFMDVWNNIDRYDETCGTFRNWICAIARFRSIDYLRRYNRRTSRLDTLSNMENVQADDFHAAVDVGAQTCSFHAAGDAVARADGYRAAVGVGAQTDGIPAADGVGCQTDTERIMSGLSEKMEQLMRNLPETDRDILLRYYCMEESVADIADDYGVAEGTVYSRVSRAKSKLRRWRGGEVHE